MEDELFGLDEDAEMGDESNLDTSFSDDEMSAHADNGFCCVGHRRSHQLHSFDQSINDSIDKTLSKCISCEVPIQKCSDTKSPTACDFDDPIQGCGENVNEKIHTITIIEDSHIDKVRNEELLETIDLGHIMNTSGGADFSYNNESSMQHDNDVIGVIAVKRYSPPSFDELINAGFSEETASNILDDSRVHPYTGEELYAILHSENPQQAYNDMMDIKVHDTINRADALIDWIENSGIIESSCHQVGDTISFLGSAATEARDRHASSLQSELDYKYIHIIGAYEYDSTYGGFDRATGQKIHDAIEQARGQERIYDYTYRQLMDKLDQACYYQ